MNALIKPTIRVTFSEFKNIPVKDLVASVTDFIYEIVSTDTKKLTQLHVCKLETNQLHNHKEPDTFHVRLHTSFSGKDLGLEGDAEYPLGVPDTFGLEMIWNKAKDIQTVISQITIKLEELESV